MKKLFLSVAVVAALYSCQQTEKASVAGAQTVDMDAAKKAIDESNLKFGNAMAAGDSATVVASYHSEAKVYPPGMPASDNPASMGSMVKALPGMGIKKVELKAVELINAGDHVIEQGNFEMGDGTNTVDKGKYLVIWKQEAGKWKMFRDIWNSDNPPAAAH